eukprot:2122286-Amphidinium_carterae.1
MCMKRLRSASAYSSASILRNQGGTKMCATCSMQILHACAMHSLCSALVKLLLAFCLEKVAGTTLCVGHFGQWSF